MAKNWTPELAARETKIKVDRLRDLETDDYTHFSSPTYARGFVRTYARFLGLDEYKILRQLDNKLPDDEGSNIVTDSGVPYLPETSMPPRAAHRDYTGLYVVTALAVGVLCISAFVLFEAYRIGEFPRYFANNPGSDASNNSPDTNTAPVTAETETPPLAVPVDPNDTTHAPKAMPVDPAALATETPVASSTNTAPADPATDITHAVKALPVDPAALTNAIPVALPVSAEAPAPPRALPVDPSQLAAIPPTDPAASTNAAPQTPPVTPPAPRAAPLLASARQSNSGPVVMPPGPVIAPVAVPATPATPPATTATTVPTTTPPPLAPPTDSGPGKSLILTASQDSFVRVTSLDTPDTDKPLYASVLHSGQSVAFDGRKFSINVGVPSAVDIKLDGVNYGPHSDHDAPETFTVESHQ